MKHIFNEDDLKNVSIDSGVHCFHAADGYYRLEQTPLGLFSVKMQEVKSLPEGREFFIPSLEKKIPYELLLQIISFFKKQYELAYTECMAQIFFDLDKKEYFVYIPIQEATLYHVDIERNHDLESNHLLIMDIHSHHAMPAVFSRQDNCDEKGTRLYAVVGDISHTIPSITVRAGCGGHFLIVDQMQIFDIPECATFPVVSFPIDWFKNVYVAERKRYSTTDLFKNL